jgi:hypothetical protein
MPANEEFLDSKGANMAKEGGLISKESRTPLCPEHEVPCQIRQEAEGVFAYHTDVTRHRFPIEETDMYQYVINYPRFFQWFARNGLGLECQEGDVDGDNFVVWASTRCSEESLNLILVPASKDGTLGRLFTLLSELKSPRNSLIVTHDSIQEQHGTAIELLSGGFTTCCRTQDLGNNAIREAVLKLSLFRSRVERTFVNLHELALDQINFGLDDKKYVDDKSITSALFAALKSEDWTEFEKLCRYVFSRLMPSSLHGYGKGDTGRLPDSVGILPNEKNEPDRFVLFDAKSLTSLAKDRFYFDRSDPAKYVDYVETANQVRKYASFGGITLLFVAPGYSVKNATNFVTELNREIGQRGISGQVETEFLTLGALTILYLASSDIAQATVMKSKDPTGDFERLLFSPIQLVSHLTRRSTEPEGFPHLTQHGAIIVDESIVQNLLVDFYGGNEQYDSYFEHYHELAKKV